ncbi:MAG TPA: glycoside hydrolase family 3 N-terminal domain-containing protein, partial [Gemmatimonadales bacterium]|nr:glycoside hydrolase family 3 N-terminal domain-containing protein [Gemmatimonadales bacterium]
MTLPVGRLLFPALRWSPATGFSHESRTIERALAFGAGGFVLFGGTPAAVGGLTRELTARAGRPLLFAADLERGAGQQFEGYTEFPPPAALAALGDATAIAEAAGTTAAEAARVGVRWILGPVADLDVEPRNPIVQTRAFSADPTRTSA